jgi:hypothetical protein
VNREVWQSANDIDRSYLMYREVAYGSVELTRREKSLQHKKQLLSFYSFAVPTNQS